MTLVFSIEVSQKIIKGFCLEVLTKVVFSATMLTIVLFYGKKWMVTKVLIIAPSVALDYVVSDYGAISVLPYAVAEITLWG